MKTNIPLRALVATGLVAFGLVGCGKDFLEKEPSELLTPKQLGKNAMWNPNILLGQVSGTVQVSFANGQTTSGQHSDFAQKATDIATDLLSSDMELTNDAYGHFASSADLRSTLSTEVLFSYSHWRIYYKVISAANSIFDALGSDETAPATAANKYYWGQAKVLRAYAYFYLANLYAGPYETSRDQKILPLYRASSPAATEPVTTAEIYTLIIKDLTEGIAALESSGVTRSAKSDINANVGYAYLAYAYLQSGDYASAYTAAKKVIDSGEFSLIPASDIAATGFNNVDNPEFMWAIDITKQNTGGLVTFWGHMDIYTYSYAYAGDRKVINGNLYAQIPSTDLRKGWFSANSGLPLGKFYTAVRGSSGQLVPGGDRQWESDIHFMRLADMYLVGMEAAARNGQASEAKALLIALMTNRVNASDLSAVTTEINGLSDADLLERIYYNWRVEMWGEGRALMTMKRFKKSVTRTTRSKFRPGETISYDDTKLLHQRPEREQANNPYF